jgi:hypothetical protein
MTESEALDYLKTWSEPDRDPKLAEAMLAACLRRRKLIDGTYDDEAVMLAVADAWDLKANKATDYHDVSVNGRGMSTSQIKKHCHEQAAWFRRNLPVHVA